MKPTINVGEWRGIQVVFPIPMRITVDPLPSTLSWWKRMLTRLIILVGS